MLAPTFAHAESRTKPMDDCDLRVERILGQSICRNAVTEHSTSFRIGIEQRASMTLLKQVVSGRQSCRTRTNDRHGLAARFHAWWQIRRRSVLIQIGGIAM